MVKVSTSFNIGNRDDMTVEKLIDIIESMYSDLAEAVNSKPDIYERANDGQPTDSFLPNGSININKSTQKVEMLTGRINPSTVTWTTLS